MESDGIFQKLRNGKTIDSHDPDAYKWLEESSKTRKLLLGLNNSIDPSEIREDLGQITYEKIENSVNVFTPFNINYGKNTKIGKGVFINLGCIILDLGGVQIDDNVLIAPRVSLLSESHPIAREQRHCLGAGPIHIKRNAWIGAGATILKNVTKGENSVVAAGAVVSKDVPDNTVVGGIPAKVLNLEV